MLILCNNDLVRELRFHDELIKVGSDPQPWQTKNFYDAAVTGAELLWPYADWNTTEEPEGFEIEWVSDDLFAVSFPSHVSVMENHNLFIFPHHSSFIALSKDQPTPFAVPQMIEADWWPGELKVYFLRRDCNFIKREPCAQALPVMRQDCTVSQMPKSEVEHRDNAIEFIREHEDQITTRKVGSRTNVYERLSHLKKSGDLPEEIKPKKEPNLRLFWK